MIVKIVGKFQNRYYSWIVSGKGQVEYKIGEKVYPPDWLREKGFGLTVFRTLDDAKEFFQKRLSSLSYRPHYWAYFFKAKIGKRLPLPPFCDIYELYQGYLVPEYSEKKFPKGTIFTEWVMLEKEIKL